MLYMGGGPAYGGQRRPRSCRRCAAPVPPLPTLLQNLGEPCHEWFVRHVEPERRDSDAVVGERGEIGAVALGVRGRALIGDPVIGVAATVAARLDAQQFLGALALGADRDALHAFGRAIREIDIDEDI